MKASTSKYFVLSKCCSVMLYLGISVQVHNVDIGVKKRCRIMSPDFPGKIIKGP